MIELLRETSRFIHIVLGFVGLVAFWFPVFAKKGGRLHVAAGKLFTVSGYGVTVSAFVSCLLITAHALSRGAGLGDLAFAVFLGYLALITFTSLRHGVRVVATRSAPHTLATPFHLVLARASVASSALLVAYALIFRSPMSILLLALSPVGWGIGTSVLRYAGQPPAFKRAWLYEHMSATLGAGIAFHTAFAVFGAGRLFGLEPSGVWGFLPWILPSAIGIPAGYLWERHYRTKLGDPLPGATASMQSPSTT